jgi:hypothetical protein
VIIDHLNIQPSHFGVIFHFDLLVWIILELLSHLTIGLLLDGILLDSIYYNTLVYIGTKLQGDFVCLSLEHLGVNIKLVLNVFILEVSRGLILMNELFDIFPASFLDFSWLIFA